MNARCSKLLILVVPVVLLALVLAPLAGAQEGPIPEAVGLRPDAPPYALHGPYWVGTREMVIEPESERPLSVTVWYPALNPDGLEETIEYSIVPKVELGMPPEWSVPIYGHALFDAEPDISAAPYPLVIFSHGFGTNRQTAAYLTEHLASYGFVVIAADHIEMWDPMLSELWESSIERPLDIQLIMAYAGSLAGPDGDMAGLFDINQTAVAGHSYGGFTALAAAGARFDLDAFNARCLEAPPNSDIALNCSIIGPRVADMAAMAGYDAVPEGLWPSWGDPHVKAIVSLAGTSFLYGEASKREITVPVLAMVGTLDTGGEALTDTMEIYQSVSSAQKALVTFAHADHYIFNWSCKNVPDLVDLGFFGVCSDSVWDMDRAEDLTNHFTTAFLLATLKDDADAAAALAPDAVSFPGITYETQGF